MLNAEIWEYSTMVLYRTAKYGNDKNFDNAGFTIIEVLIALAIFAIGILGVAKLQLAAVGDNTSSRKYTEASTWGVSQVESIMAIPYDDPALAAGATGTLIRPSGLPGSPGVYTVNWTITDADPVPNVKKISIVVTWDNNKSFSADYYRAIKF